VVVKPFKALFRGPSLEKDSYRSEETTRSTGGYDLYNNYKVVLKWIHIYCKIDLKVLKILQSRCERKSYYKIFGSYIEE